MSSSASGWLSCLAQRGSRLLILRFLGFVFVVPFGQKDFVIVCIEERSHTIEEYLFSMRCSDGMTLR